MLHFANTFDLLSTDFHLALNNDLQTYEVCRKLDPKAHKVLGTYLIAYGPWGVFAMVFASTVINVGGAVGFAFSLDGQLMSDSFQLTELQVWPVSFLVTPALVVFVSLFFLNITGSPGKSHKWVELFSILSLLFQWFAIPIAVRAGLFVYGPVETENGSLMWAKVPV